MRRDSPHRGVSVPSSPISTSMVGFPRELGKRKKGGKKKCVRCYVAVRPVVLRTVKRRRGGKGKKKKRRGADAGSQPQVLYSTERDCALFPLLCQAWGKEEKKKKKRKKQLVLRVSVHPTSPVWGRCALGEKTKKEEEKVHRRLFLPAMPPPAVDQPGPEPRPRQRKETKKENKRGEDCRTASSVRGTLTPPPSPCSAPRKEGKKGENRW